MAMTKAQKESRLSELAILFAEQKAIAEQATKLAKQYSTELKKLLPEGKTFDAGTFDLVHSSSYFRTIVDMEKLASILPDWETTVTKESKCAGSIKIHPHLIIPK